jgi:hypothetical protein
MTDTKSELISNYQLLTLFLKYERGRGRERERERVRESKRARES